MITPLFQQIRFESALLCRVHARSHLNKRERAPCLQHSGEAPCAKSGLNDVNKLVSRRASAGSASASSQMGDKLRILCLHGFLQNAEVFKEKIGSMRKGLKSRVELVFVDAPYEAVGNSLDGDEEQNNPNGRSWWQWQDVGGRPSLASTYTGWEHTYEYLQEQLEQHQPIDGVLGFSQGATATALFLASLHKDNKVNRSPRFAIMVAGFLPRDPAYAQLVTDTAAPTPSLFVYGTGDKLVPPERSKALASAFPAAQLYEHPGAHFVPTTSGPFKQTLVAFLDNMKQGSVNVSTAAIQST